MSDMTAELDGLRRLVEALANRVDAAEQRVGVLGNTSDAHDRALTSHARLLDRPPAPDLAAQLAEAREVYAAIESELSGVRVTCSNITGQPAVDRIRSLRTQQVNDIEAIAAYCDDVFGVCVGADIRAGRWRAAQLVAKEGE